MTVKFFAIMSGGRVAEINPDPIDWLGSGVLIPLSERFHPDLIAQMVECPEYVGINWSLVGEVWTPPAIPPATGDEIPTTNAGNGNPPKPPST